MILYVLEVLQKNVPKKLPYSYSRGAVNILHQDIWKQKFASEDKFVIEQLMAIKETKGEKCRIIKHGKS